MSHTVLKIKDIIQEIKLFFNNSTTKKTKVFLKKNEGDWTQFCAAADTIRDVSFAIENFNKDPNV
jgi:hypothetical protein